jgi:DNA topoisomerase IB
MADQSTGDYPAWRSVWICPNAMGHLQATGRDARGRKQYRYHEEWRRLRDRMKYDHVLDLAEYLPAIRRRVSRDLHGRGLSRDTKDSRTWHGTVLAGLGPEEGRPLRDEDAGDEEGDESGR